jgi:hypothetical protein
MATMRDMKEKAKAADRQSNPNSHTWKHLFKCGHTCGLFRAQKRASSVWERLICITYCTDDFLKVLVAVSISVVVTFLKVSLA